MAESKTKYQATQEEIIALFRESGVQGIKKIEPLGAGELSLIHI